MQCLLCKKMVNSAVSALTKDKVHIILGANSPDDWESYHTCEEKFIKDGWTKALICEDCRLQG